MTPSLKMGRYLVHDCPECEEIYLPPFIDGPSWKWDCEFCGYHYEIIQLNAMTVVER